MSHASSAVCGLYNSNSSKVFTGQCTRNAPPLADAIFMASDNLTAQSDTNGTIRSCPVSSDKAQSGDVCLVQRCS